MPNEDHHPQPKAGLAVRTDLVDRAMNGQKMATMLVEQDHDVAQELADEYLVMKRGEIVQRGPGTGVHAEGVRAKMSS